jgi:hypothetical protein
MFGEMEEQLLDFKSFLRVHHSFPVNLNEVNNISGVTGLCGDGRWLYRKCITGPQDSLMKILEIPD